MSQSIVGKKFNYWTVLETGHRIGVKPGLKCLCDCGTVRVCDSGHITAERSKSCGCIRKTIGIKVPESLIGRVFGKITIVAEGRISCGYRGKENATKQSVTYQCGCGVVRETTRRYVVKGLTKSCGCLNKDRLLQKATTHGYASRNGRSSTYTTWANVVSRATKPPKDGKKSGYYDRGIAERWLKFENFLADMGEKPDGERVSIERVDNKMGYFPGNCIWAGDNVQARNKSTNRFYTINGETLCLTDWATRYGLNEPTVRRRIDRGATVEQSLNLKPWDAHHSRRVSFEIDGITKVRKEWCEQYSQDEQKVRSRMRGGKDIKQALRIN